MAASKLLPIASSALQITLLLAVATLIPSASSSSPTSKPHRKFASLGLLSAAKLPICLRDCAQHKRSSSTSSSSSSVDGADTSGTGVDLPVPLVSTRLVGESYIRPAARRNVPLRSAVIDWMKRSDVPWQVHISLAGRTAMRVTWATTKRSSENMVEYGERPGKYTKVARGSMSQYRFVFYWSTFLHTAVLGQSEGALKPATTYYYRCGGKGRERSFKTPPDATDAPLNVAIVGDLGQTGWSLTTLRHISDQPHDMVVVPGDLSYADFNPWRWDVWQALIEPYASRRPWMVVPGNHDKESFTGVIDPYVSYRHRWRMPNEASGSPSNLFYSFETASVHWVMLNSYSDYGKESEQYKWLKYDLSRVNRRVTPWLVVVFHEPWYSTNERHQEDGQPMRQALEKMLFRARTDVVFTRHVHAYERTKRVYKGKKHSCGIVHIVIGDGGNREGLYTNFGSKPSWSAFREASFGHGRFMVKGGGQVGEAEWHWQRNRDDVAEAADDAYIISHASSLAPEKCRPDMPPAPPPPLAPPPPPAPPTPPSSTTE